LKITKYQNEKYIFGTLDDLDEKATDYKIVNLFGGQRFV
jgi:hypothetical protein